MQLFSVHCRTTSRCSRLYNAADIRYSDWTLCPRLSSIYSSNVQEPGPRVPAVPVLNRDEYDARESEELPREAPRDANNG